MPACLGLSSSCCSLMRLSNMRPATEPIRLFLLPPDIRDQRLPGYVNPTFTLIWIQITLHIKPQVGTLYRIPIHVVFTSNGENAGELFNTSAHGKGTSAG